MATELTGQISALEDEVNILKGEVKSILEEIRTALLDRDNPFSPQVQANLESVKALLAEREAVLTSAVPPGLPVFQPVQRPGSAEEPAEPGQEASAGPAPPPTADGPAMPQGPAPGPVTGVQVTNAQPLAPAAPPASLPAANSGPQVATTTVEAAAPQPVAANPGSAGNPTPVPPIADEAGPEPWSVSTIAGLVAWIDETTSRLGATHLHMLLDLARFGGLLPSEAEDVLLKVIKLASSRKDSASPSVNDILLALRQLEAILQGDDADELSLVRRRRTAGAGRSR